ncbi:MAG: CPBP family intramembrane metalloprotease [Planctomycetes bacterium]|nr:CPBP family intramembrane metalloprotease [Planctomycetota bacterium]
MADLLRRFWNYFFVEPWQRIDRENRAFLAREESRCVDGKVVWVLLTAGVVLTLQAYLDSYHDWIVGLLRLLGLDRAGARFDAFMTDPEDARLKGYVYWALFSFATYVFLPCLVILFVFRERVRDYGLKPRGAFADWWIYVVLFGVMLPILFVISHNAHFQQTYPFYKIQPGQPLWPRFWVWELSYGVQFIGLEFFFRGFMVHGTKHRFGFYAIFVMTVPYCMIHFRKPMPETLGALVAGIALGFLSLKTRSIWIGTALHMSMALSMDFLCMWRQGLFS